MQTYETTTQSELIRRYCERQESTPQALQETLNAQRERYNPDGHMLLECQMLDSSRLGSLVILPFGPSNTFKTPPTHPISPRGLASDMSIVVAVCRYVMEPAVNP